MTDFKQERELAWDDTIQQDNDNFVLLKPGDYIFEVVKFERGRYTPSPTSKIPACPSAKIELRIESPQGVAIVFHNLYLHSSMEGMLSAFFAAIGMKKKGEPLQMNWNAVVGAKGACKIKNREYNERKYNEVQNFYAKDGSYYENKQMPEILQQLLQANQSYQQPVNNQQQFNTQPPVTNQPPQQSNNFTAGQF